jgi:hypothetical protein
MASRKHSLDVAALISAVAYVGLTVAWLVAS